MQLKTAQFKIYVIRYRFPVPVLYTPPIPYIVKFVAQ